MRRAWQVLLASLGLSACTLLDPLDDIVASVGPGVDSPFDGGTDGADVDVAIDGAIEDVVDASTCDLAAPFQAPARAEMVEGLASDKRLSEIRLSPDELVAYMVVFDILPDGASYYGKLWVATRESRSASFHSPQQLAFPSDPTVGRSKTTPFISADGNALFFTSATGNIQSADIFVARRPSALLSFGVPTGAPVNLPDPSGEADPYIVGGELWFISNRAGTNGVYSALLLDGGGAAVPVHHAELASSGFRSPTLTQDGRTLIASADLDGGLGKGDLFIAQRGSSDASFGAPQRLTSLSSAEGDAPNWISHDGCRLYFMGSRPSDHHYLVAERPPR